MSVREVAEGEAAKLRTKVEALLKAPQAGHNTSTKIQKAAKKILLSNTVTPTAAHGLFNCGPFSLKRELVATVVLRPRSYGKSSDRAASGHIETVGFGIIYPNSYHMSPADYANSPAFE